MRVGVRVRCGSVRPCPQPLTLTLTLTLTKVARAGAFREGRKKAAEQQVEAAEAPPQPLTLIPTLIPTLTPTLHPDP